MVYDLADPTQTGAWTLSHPIYTEQVCLVLVLYCARLRVAADVGTVTQEVNSVKVVWRSPKTVGDWIARGMVHLSR